VQPIMEAAILGWNMVSLGMVRRLDQQQAAVLLHLEDGLLCRQA